MTEVIIAGIVALVIGLIGFIIGRLYGSKIIGELTGRLSQTEHEQATIRDELSQRQARIDELSAELSDRKAELAAIKEQIAEKERSLAQQKDLLEKARETLQETFKALAGETLKSTSTSFLQLAQEKLSGILAQTKGDIGKQRAQIEAVIKPMQEAMTKYEEHLRSVERARQEAYGGLTKHLKVLGETQARLQDRTSELTSALRNPQVKGRWGELTLQRAAEIAGMSQYCDFEMQVSTDTADGKLRPDMVIRLPGDRRIVVDAKAPCDAYLDALQAGDDNQRRTALDRYAQAVRQHARQLGNKSYWDQFGSDSPEFVVLFLPGESFFSAALEVNHSLIEQAMENRVILASPTTLITLLRSVAFAWRQETLAESAEEIRETGKELYERVVNFFEHLNALSKNLNGAVQSYNSAVGSLQQRLAPSARRLSALGLTAKKELREPPTIDRQARQLPTPVTDDNANST